MEKKTIGKLIAALRKANGMTQKELGEKLYVSDKTVSRWERDECTPELSLIPALAEIFGITADELLRGERNNPERDDPAPQETAARQRAKSEKQVRLMLDRNKRKFHNLTFVSVGITVLGLIAAIAVNSGLSRGLFAFCLAAAFCVASEICQLIFTVNARIGEDEEDEAYNQVIRRANAHTARTTVGITFGNLALLAFCLPLVTDIDGANFGMTFAPWVESGAAFALVALVVGWILYLLLAQKPLVKLGWLEKPSGYPARLFAKCLLIGGCVFLLIVAGYNALESYLKSPKVVTVEFDNWQEFKSYVESAYDSWYQDIAAGNVMPPEPDEWMGAEILLPDTEIQDDQEEEEPFYPHRVKAEYRNRAGELIFSYYYNPDFYRSIEILETEDGQIESVSVRVFTQRTDTQLAAVLPVALTALDVLITLAVYMIKLRKYKKAL